MKLSTVAAKAQTKRYDVLDYLKTDEELLAYLNAALEQGDLGAINVALGDIARAKGMKNLSDETKLNRAGLYRSLSATGNPSFETILRVIAALGLKFEAKPIAQA